MKSRRAAKVAIGYWPSHHRLCDIVDYSAHGGVDSPFTSARALDHVGELCLLMHGDVDDLLWKKDSPKAGRTTRKVIDSLSERVRVDEDLASAEALYAIAIYSTFEVMQMYIRHRSLFDRIAPRRTILPCLSSIHPKTARVSSEMQRDSRLGTQTPESCYIRSRAWYLARTRGSHRQYKHPRKSGLVTVPGKPSDDLAPGTANSILKQAGLK